MEGKIHAGENTEAGKKTISEHKASLSESITSSNTELLSVVKDTGANSTADLSTYPGVNFEDRLMAGDYRPLKSVLKKSKKEPRLSKNIHHNYFMTMRGHKPHLVPFPHGFHPQPHKPRNTLWWHNIPNDADHIMAKPPVAKVPKEDDDDDEGETQVDNMEKEVKQSQDLEKGKPKEQEKSLATREKISKDKPAENGKDRDATAGSNREKAKTSSSGEKTRLSDREKVADKEKEQAKTRVAVEDKDKVKIGADTETKARDHRQPARPAETNVIAMDPQL
jgi:hypothetical protein